MSANINDRETHQRARELMECFGFAVRKAQEQSRSRGVANVYSIDGQLHYELPTGELTSDPSGKRRTPPPPVNG